MGRMGIDRPSQCSKAIEGHKASVRLPSLQVYSIRMVHRVRHSRSTYDPTNHNRFRGVPWHYFTGTGFPCSNFSVLDVTTLPSLSNAFSSTLYVPGGRSNSSQLPVQRMKPPS